MLIIFVIYFTGVFGKQNLLSLRGKVGVNPFNYSRVLESQHMLGYLVMYIVHL